MVPGARSRSQRATDITSGWRLAISDWLVSVCSLFVVAATGAYQEVAARQQSSKAEADRKTATSRNTSSRPSLPLSKYAGIYTDAWYGDIMIERKGTS